MKCHWCEKETENCEKEFLNGFLNVIKVSFCDRCEEANAIADKAEGLGHRERLNETDRKVCESLNSTNT